MPHTFFKIPVPLVLPQNFTGTTINLIPADSAREGREMLDRLTGALGCTEGVEVCTLDIGHDVSAAADLWQHAAARGETRSVIVYGLTPRSVGGRWRVAPYTWVRDRTIGWCFAERLEEIAGDQNKKKILWTAIKHLKVR